MRRWNIQACSSAAPKALENRRRASISSEPNPGVKGPETITILPFEVCVFSGWTTTCVAESSLAIVLWEASSPMGRVT